MKYFRKKKINFLIKDSSLNRQFLIFKDTLDSNESNGGEQIYE